MKLEKMNEWLYPCHLRLYIECGIWVVLRVSFCEGDKEGADFYILVFYWDMKFYLNNLIFIIDLLYVKLINNKLIIDNIIISIIYSISVKKNCDIIVSTYKEKEKEWRCSSRVKRVDVIRKKNKGRLLCITITII